LSSDLDQLFAQTLTSLTELKGENKGTELEKNKWISDLTECLRIYDVLGLWRDAEDVIRREVMRPFIKKVDLAKPLLDSSLIRSCRQFIPEYWQPRRPQ
jgi:hypothetical protein